MPSATLTPEDQARFWSWVTKTDDCWLWTGTKKPKGYGSFQAGGKTLLTHRVAYELLAGPISAGLQIDHLCRVRNCVNPAHMEPVTARENVLRGDAPTAANARKTHCSRGHELTPENTRVRPKGRECRTCHRDRMRLAMRRKRASNG